MFKGKTALVTGSTSGIGWELRARLAAGGANLVLNGLRRRGRDRKAARGPRQRAWGHGRLRRRRHDQGRSDRSHDAEGDRALRIGGLLINNAGIQHVAPVDEFPVERWNAIIAINLSAAFHTTRAALGAMKKKRWGRIVNIASAHALVASPFKSAYVAAKHGVAGFTKAAALEVAELGITVNAVCPGYVRTPLVEKQIPDQAKARGISEQQVVQDVLLAVQPTKQFVTVEQVAELTAFLC
jgi:3-hydroxybutyrate dehydrogenase